MRSWKFISWFSRFSCLCHRGYLRLYMATLRVDTWVSAAFVAAMSFGALIAFRDWKEWINCILGVWIAVSPWVFGFQHTAAMLVNLAIGILIAYLAMLELWLIHYGSSSEKTI